MCAQAITSASPASTTRLGRVAGRRLDHDRVGQERRAARARRELRGELAVGQVQRALAHQAARRRVPERGRAAVAERRPRSRRAARTARAARRGSAPTSCLTGFWRCEVPISGCAACGEVLELLGTHARRARAEPPVGGLQLVGNLQDGSVWVMCGSSKWRDLHAQARGCGDARRSPVVESHRSPAPVTHGPEAR